MAFLLDMIKSRRDGKALDRRTKILIIETSGQDKVSTAPDLRGPGLPVRLNLLRRDSNGHPRLGQMFVHYFSLAGLCGRRP